MISALLFAPIMYVVKVMDEFAGMVVLPAAIVLLRFPKPKRPGLAGFEKCAAASRS